MTDPRLEKLADVLVNYSLDVQPGNKMIIRTSPLGEELALAAYSAGLRAGAHIDIQCDFPRAAEVFLKNASQAQLEFVPAPVQLIYDTYDRFLSIGAEQNTRGLSAVDPGKRALRSRATHSLMKTMMERTARGELSWCYTVIPTFASAQEADMSLGDYEEFVYKADKLDEPDPTAAWKAFGVQMQTLSSWLKGRRRAAGSRRPPIWDGLDGLPPQRSESAGAPRIASAGASL